MTLPLARFMAVSEPIRLRNTRDEYSLFVPISSRLKVNSAVLHLQLANSISLMRERSQLAVRINGRLLAQVGLNPQQPEAAVDIRLPASSLKAGYNKLTFAVVQHYTLRCEDPSAPELWTEIDTVASTLTFDSEPMRLTPRLSDMAKLFDPKSWADQSFTIVTASDSMRDEQLQWGALVAQGAALHLRYAPLRALHQTAVRTTEAASAQSTNFPGLQQQSLRGSDTALIGTKAELAPFLSKQLLDNIGGSFLGVYPLDADPSRFVLLVSGTTPAEVAQAANAFAFLGFPYPDSSSMQVSAVEYPRLTDYSQKGALAPGAAFKFAQLGYKTTTVKGIGVGSLNNEEQGGSLELEIIMPPDLFTHEDSNVDLVLHFAYGASLRKDSVLNIMLNDRFERAIPLSLETGAVYHKYQVSVPLRSFQPGLNRIRFVPRMMPLISGECLAIQSENLLLTLYADSVLKMPDASHFVAMPNFRLLSRAGFPYSINADGSGALVHVASTDSKTISSAWTLVAKLGQRNGAPLRQAIISFALPQQDRDLIVIGTVGKIQGPVLKGAPIELGPFSKVPYRIGFELPTKDSGDNWLGWPKTRGNLAAAAADGNRGPAVRMTQSGALTNSALAMQYESPLSSGRTATVFVAVNEDVLLDGITELIKPEIWNDLQGNVVIWNKGAESVSWQRVGGDYTVGEVNMPGRVEFYFSKYPWAWILVLLALVTVLAFLTTRLVRRFHRKTHPEA